MSSVSVSTSALDPFIDAFGDRSPRSVASKVADARKDAIARAATMVKAYSCDTDVVTGERVGT